MIKGFQFVFALYCLLVIMVVHSTAAPLPPFAPVDITGRIQKICWVAEQQSKGIPGMSGSAGQDRTFPAHFLLKLTDYTGVNAEIARQMTGYIDGHALGEKSEKTLPAFILLQINHEDRNVLKKGMTIRVDGYTVKGDEGGAWTSYARLEVLQHEE